MENLSRDLRRDLEISNSRTLSKRENRWTLLLVGSQGKIVSWGNAKGLVIALALVLCVGFGASAILSSLYSGVISKNAKLRGEVDATQAKITPLRSERDILMAQLSVAEAIIEVLRSERQRRVGKSPDALMEPGRGTEGRSGEIAQLDTDTPTATAIEEFKLFYDPDTSDLEIEFRLVNILESHEPVSGFIFVILERDEGADPPLTLPAVNLESGRPADIDRGRYFIISNFNIIRFATTVQSSPEGYQSATVFVYEKTGKLLLEKVFPVKILGPPPVRVD